MSDGIVVIDYGMGNLRSVQRKFEKMGGDVIVSSDPDEISNAGKLVLPGVGHFGAGVINLKEKGIWKILNSTVLEKKTPVLGICLGMQLMANNSEEGNAEGLGWFNANVIRFNVSDKLKYKVPHIGWNQCKTTRTDALFNGITADSSYYFVHSYHIVSNEPNDVLATTEYDYNFVSVIKKDNIYGVQFHPEKSHDIGSKLLMNFMKL